MNTRTIQITMFWCTLCPNLRSVETNGAFFISTGKRKTIFTCKGTPKRDSRFCKEIPSPINGGSPEIPDWCPLSKDKVEIF